MDYSLESFKMANREKAVSEIDYVRSLYKSLNLHFDFLRCFARLVSPEFIVVDGRVFLMDLFDTARIDQLRRGGCDSRQVQFWSNLLEVTGIFDNVSMSQAQEIALILVKSWNSKIAFDCAGAIGRARLIVDESAGEVFVCVDDPESVI